MQDPSAWLPLPLARPYARLDEAGESPTARFGNLLDLFEALVHFLTVVGTSAYDASGLDDPLLSRRLLGVLLQPSWSTGSLLQLALETSRRLASHPAHPYPELAGQLFRPDGRATPAHQLLLRTAELRNREWGHAGGRSDARYAALLAQHEAPLRQLVAAWTWLGERPLVGRTDAGVCLLLRGTDPAPAPADLRPDPEPEVGGTWIRGPGSRWLRLNALARAREQLSKRGVFFLQRLRLDGRTVRSLRYVAYDPGLVDHEEREGGEAAAEVSDLLHRLGGDALDRVDADELLLPEVEQLRARHRDPPSGRLRDAESIRAHLDGGAGWLLLVGPPGQGKSTLLAHAAARDELALFHAVAVHGAPTRFVPALAAQARRLAGPTVDLGRRAFDDDDLRQVILAAAVAVRDARGRCALLLDGLDELSPAAWGLPFLPTRLPEGVVGILSCRPDPTLLGAIRSRFPDVQVRELPPLDREASMALLRQAGVTTVRASELATRCEGNPLLLGMAARGLASGRREELGADLLRHALGDADGREDRRRVLALLALAHEPLSPEDLLDLAESTELPAQAVRQAVDDLGPFLAREGGRLRLFHGALADRVRSELGGRERRSLEAGFVEWIGPVPRRFGPYARRHWGTHAVAARRPERVAEILGRIDPADEALTASAATALEELAGAGEVLPAYGVAVARAWSKRCEGRGWWALAEDALAVMEASGCPGVALRAAQLASARGDTPLAERLARRAVAEAPPGRERWQALNALARALIDLADEPPGRDLLLAEARSILEHLVASAIDDPNARSRAQNNLGVLLRLAGAKDEAWSLQLQAAATREGLGERYRAWSLHDLASLHADLGRDDEARDCLVQAVGLARRAGDPQAELWCHRSLARLGDRAALESACDLHLRLGPPSWFYEVAGYGIAARGAIAKTELARAAEDWWLALRQRWPERSPGWRLASLGLAWVSWALGGDAGGALGHLAGILGPSGPSSEAADPIATRAATLLQRVGRREP